jgi:hypothetical protein
LKNGGRWWGIAGKIVEKGRDLTRRKISINNRRMATPGSCVEQGFPMEGAD